MGHLVKKDEAGIEDKILEWLIKGLLIGASMGIIGLGIGAIIGMLVCSLL